MSKSAPPSNSASDRFFDKYLICLSKANINSKQRQWYVKHLEAFIKAQNGVKIKSLSSSAISNYFDALGRRKQLKSWQFIQNIHAIQILYCDLFALSLCRRIDWDYWKSSAKQLEDDHPTVAHNLTPEQLRYIKERKGEGPLQQVRSNHKDLLIKLVSVIRIRGYAYRTEQTYEQWACRFILFSASCIK